MKTFFIDSENVICSALLANATIKSQLEHLRSENKKAEGLVHEMLEEIERLREENKQLNLCLKERSFVNLIPKDYWKQQYEDLREQVKKVLGDILRDKEVP
jgi:predicted nuclease with TOPRIM domain